MSSAAARHAMRGERRGDGLDLETLQEETNNEEEDLWRQWLFALPAVRSL